jgi:threonylcarbamoyladenosine tRNA methylthiotransferase MtaB
LDNKPTSKSTRVAFETLGCKLNQAETEQLSRQLKEAGCPIVPPDQDADIYILNTCTVTHIADRKSRHLLRMTHRKNPDAKIIALGCYAGRAANELAAIEGVDLVIGNEDKSNLKTILENAGFLKSIDTEIADLHSERTRSFIKVQDGCSNFCTYCIVPLVRGKEKSVPVEQVIRDIKLRASEGFKEVVLTGTEIGSYLDRDLDFQGLIQKVLKETRIPRLRISSVQPQEISPGLLELWENPRLCPHFHLSLQSGSDTVLQRMNRRYNRADYRKAVDLIRSRVKDAAITTDIIVGFPAETDSEFQDSYDFCRDMGFDRIHVFVYSPREGTRAALMSGQIEAAVKKQRSEKMLALAEKSLLNFQNSYVGSVQEVLFEQSTHGLSSGVTPNYIKVYTKTRLNLANQLLKTKLIKPDGEGMWGELV